LWRSSAAGIAHVSPLLPRTLTEPIPLNDQADTHPELQLHYLADVPSLLPAVAAAYWAEWGREDFEACDEFADVRALEEWLARDCSHRDQLGCTIVATLQTGGSDVLVGAAMLAPEDTPVDHSYFGVRPWASYNVIVPSFRGRGYSKVIWRRVSRLAEQFGFRHCWAVSELSNVRYYEKLGWRAVETLDFWGVQETIMRIDFKDESQRSSAVVAVAHASAAASVNEVGKP
jgi:GNAT superfamily N-acetyltransferase